MPIMFNRYYKWQKLGKNKFGKLGKLMVVCSPNLNFPTLASKDEIHQICFHHMYLLVDLPYFIYTFIIYDYLKLDNSNREYELLKMFKHKNCTSLLIGMSRFRQQNRIMKAKSKILEK